MPSQMTNRGARSDQLRGQGGDHLLAVHCALGLERGGEAPGEFRHLGMSRLGLLAANRDPHEFVSSAEVFLRVGHVHRINEDAPTGFLQQGQGRLLHQPGIELALP